MRMELEATPNYGSHWSAIAAVAHKLGVDTAEAVLSGCVRPRSTLINGPGRLLMSRLS